MRAPCLAALTAAIVASSAFAVEDADPTKSNGDFIAGSGIPGDSFVADSNGDVAVFLKPRARDNGDPLLISGNTFLLLGGDSMDAPGTSWWRFDFQFTPAEGDTVGGTNYILTLEVDLDPGPGEAPVVITAPMFDPDAVPDSWDDGDGLFTNPGPGAWSNDNINYVYSQSWDPAFSFLNGAILGPGDYTIRWSAADAEGNQLASVEAIARVIDETDSALSLDAQDNCLNASDSQVVIDINMANVPGDIVGGQFFLNYDNTVLDFVSADPGDAPFTDELYEDVDTVAGTIDYSVHAPLGNPGTDQATTMARLTFDLIGDACFEDSLVTWRANTPPTRITTSGGPDIQPSDYDLSTVTIDTEAPMLTVNDITQNADAGVCSAVISTAEPFNEAVTTAASQAAGTWYTDRYAPAIFESGTFMGENVLVHGVDIADSEANRPPSFSSPFYNTQGRKYDIDLPLGATLGADIFIPASWETDVRRQGMWGTMFDSGGNISGYPIVGFVSNDPADPSNTSPTNPTPRFRVYVQDTDFDLTNYPDDADWIDLYTLGAGDFDKWYRFEITLTEAGYLFQVIDRDADTVVASLLDPITFGSVRFGNVILQQYNFGETYQGYWDNVSLAPIGPVVSDNCYAPFLSYERSDDPGLSLNDPFPTGATTITWTATDFCGNSDTVEQIVTVNGVSDLGVVVELDAVSATIDRCVTFELTPVGGGSPVIVNETLSFVGGVANATIEVPCGDYECIDARDTLHTLRARDDDDFAIDGTMYVADFTSAGDGDALLGGNLNDDEYIDILDFGVFVSQYNMSVDADTPCGYVGPNADVNGDGTVGSNDFTFIMTQFLFFAEAPCGGAPASWGGQPITFISVEELEEMGLHDLAIADLNTDGWVDEFDVAAFASGVVPDHCDEDLSGDGVVDSVDLNMVLASFGATGAGDVNGDGVTDAADLNLVLARFTDACN